MLLRHRILNELEKVNRSEFWLAEECDFTPRRIRLLLSGKIPLETADLMKIERALNIRFDLTYAETPNG